MVRKMCQFVLERAGYKVLSAADGDEALVIATESLAELALVVTDVIMPGKTGPQLVESLRNLRPELPILFMSGYIGSERLEMSNSTFLAKPFTPPELLDKVKVLLQSSQSPDS